MGLSLLFQLRQFGLSVVAQQGVIGTWGVSLFRNGEVLVPGANSEVYLLLPKGST